MKKIFLTGLMALSAMSFGQATTTYPTRTYSGGSVENIYVSNQLQGTLTSVTVNATLAASVDETFADDLAVLVTPTSNIATIPYVLQVGGYNTFGNVPEKGTWTTGGSEAVGTIVSGTYTLITPLNFTANPTYNIWLGNGYANDTTPTNSGTWTNITLTLAGVSTSTLGTTDITAKSDIGIKVYPNPVTDIVNVEAKDSKIQSVSIIDISGKAAKTVLPQDKKDKISINFSELPTGSYILIINTEKGKFSKKIIKE